MVVGGLGVKKKTNSVSQPKKVVQHEQTRTSVSKSETKVLGKKTRTADKSVCDDKKKPDLYRVGCNLGSALVNSTRKDLKASGTQTKSSQALEKLAKQAKQSKKSSKANQQGFAKGVSGALSRPAAGDSKLH